MFIGENTFTISFITLWLSFFSVWFLNLSANLKILYFILLKLLQIKENTLFILYFLTSPYNYKLVIEPVVGLQLPKLKAVFVIAFKFLKRIVFPS